MIRRVLFVDDEPHMLEGLRDRLYPLRKRWEMTFAESGEAALELLARQPFDVLVTDMRMPKMDGAALLREVQKLYPQVARIVLSGYSELEAALRAVPVAHQFLSKPSEPGVIEAVVERACSLQALIGDDRIRETVAGIGQLPSLPRVYSELVAALAEERVSTEEVARILKRDMAICAKTLQVVNSAFFRLPRAIGRIEEAVAYLGLNSVKQIVLAVEVFQQFPRSGSAQGPSVEELQAHALLVGGAAASFFADKQKQDDAFAAGLLHDIGKLLLLVKLPERLRPVQEEMRQSGCSMHHAEEKIWGVTHAEVGGYLLGLWGLPYPVIEAVANHHAPLRVPGTEFGILAAVYLANTLVHHALDPPRSGAPGPGLDPGWVERLGVGGELAGWREAVRLQLEQRTEKGGKR